MGLKELLKKLVETDDQMERMSLVETNQELINQSENVATTEEGATDWETKYNELKQKYIDTFFGGSTDEPPTEETTETKDAETEKAENITIDDVLKGGKK